MKKSIVVKIVSFAMALSLFLFGKCIVLNNRANYYKGIISNGYEFAARELTSSVNEINTELQKVKYANSPNVFSKASSKLLVDCETAKSALSKLPCSEGEITNINKFLSQVGNYASFLAGKSAFGEEITDEEMDGLISLSDVADLVNKTVESASLELGTNEYWIHSVENLLSGKLDDNTLASIILEKDEKITDYPVLVYDGPYSDAALNTESVFLNDKPDVDETAAATVLEKISDIPMQYFDYNGVVNGKIESHIFSGENISAAISKKGGYPVYYSNARTVGDAKLSYTQALEKGYKFLSVLGETDFVYTYYFEDEGVCTINFAYKDGATVCYTDLIKIGVAMDNGDVVLLECSGYLMNHKFRSIPTPVYTFDEAREKLNKNLSVVSEDIALIPIDGREIPCFEFKCVGKNGENVNVYINTQTLKEEQILLLIITDSGTLSK